MLRQAAEHAATAKITLAIEYLNRFECYFLTTAADTLALVKAVNHPNFGTMYDTFHANIEEKQAGPAIRTLAPVLRHVHISENDRGTPGTGHVAWDETFRTLERDQLRRLDDDRGVRPGAAGVGGGDQGLARPVPGGRAVAKGDRVHETAMGRRDVNIFSPPVIDRGLNERQLVNSGNPGGIQCPPKSSSSVCRLLTLESARFAGLAGGDSCVRWCWRRLDFW